MKQNNTYPRENTYEDIDQDEIALNELNEEETHYGDSSERDILDDLSPDQLRELEESIEECERGETKPIEEILKTIEGWKDELRRRLGLT